MTTTKEAILEQPLAGEEWNRLKMIRVTATTYFLECQCGYELKFNKSTLARTEINLRDVVCCGRKECIHYQKLQRRGLANGITPQEKRRGRPFAAESKSVSSVYLPTRLIAAVQTYADKTGKSYNQCIGECLKAHLIAIGEFNES